MRSRLQAEPTRSSTNIIINTSFASFYDNEFHELNEFRLRTDIIFITNYTNGIASDSCSVYQFFASKATRGQARISDNEFHEICRKLKGNAVMSRQNYCEHSWVFDKSREIRRSLTTIRSVPIFVKFV